MKLAIGSDHAGFLLKEKLAKWLRSPAGGRHRVQNFGTMSTDSCDYPDFAEKVARAVARKRASIGLLVCGTGIGMAIAANKIRGIRAGVVWNTKIAALASEHNKVNVLCLPGRLTNFRQAQAMVKIFLKTPFGGGRHQRRIDKITALDRCG